MMTIRNCPLALAAAALLLAGIHSVAAQSEGSAAHASKPDPHRAAKADPDSARRAQVLARFTGGQVTVGDLEDAIAGKAPTERKRLAEDQDARIALLRRMVDYELLALEAARRGYTKDPVVLHRTRRFSVAEMTRDDLVPNLAAVPEAAVKARFAERAPGLRLPPMRRARVLVVASEAEAVALRKELQKGPATRFQEAVMQHSIDAPSKAQGGQLGFFDDRGRRAPRQPEFEVPEALVKVAFATRPGDISKPFAYAGGHALLMVTGENPGSEPKFAELAPELRGELTEEALQAKIDTMAEAMRAAVKPELNDSLLGLIRLDESLDNIPSGTPAAPADPTAAHVEVEPDGV